MTDNRETRKKKIEEQRVGSAPGIPATESDGSHPSSPPPFVQSFFVSGPLPGLNDFLGIGDWRVYNSAKRRWTKNIAYHIRQANLKPMHVVSITWIWIEQDKRRDIDNFTGIGKKFTLDALVQCGILKDDGWHEIAEWKDLWAISKMSPGVKVVLTEVS